MVADVGVEAVTGKSGTDHGRFPHIWSEPQIWITRGCEYHVPR